MNPLSLREICAKATPGPRIHLADERTVYTRLNDGCRGLPIFTADNDFLPAHQANLDLAARFSPATALAVYGALEGVLRVADRKTDEFDAVRRALKLLDGRTEP